MYEVIIDGKITVVGLPKEDKLIVKQISSTLPFLQKIGFGTLYAIEGCKAS